MRSFSRLAIALVFVWLGFRFTEPRSVVGHEPDEKDVRFSCSIAEVAGTLALPDAEHLKPGGSGKIPCVVIVGGTLSQTRDGGLNKPGAPKRVALLKFAHALADAGYASLRFDKVGYGESKAKTGWTGSYKDEAAVAAAAIEFARGRKDLGPILVAGESAGAYLACLAAKSGTRADGYLFLGGHCGPGEAIYEYNFAPLVKYAAQNDSNREWVEKNLRFELAIGRQYKAMFEAAKKGETQFGLVDGDFRKAVDVRRRAEELALPPDELYRHIQVPMIALAGERDLNVPPDHAAKIVSIVRQAGNHASTCVVISGADHSFQKTPDDADLRLRERHSLQSFTREYDRAFYREVISWLDKTVPILMGGSNVKSRSIPDPFARRGVDRIERDPLTESSPARTFLAPGIQIVENITNEKATAGVPTLEGRIGPLLLGQDSQAHFIDMYPGQYCEEHPHSTESIIYTVRGQWVLCSGGRRHLMKPGTLFHFAVNTPTGYEVPFAEPAYILIFKGRRTTQKDAEFVDYLKGLADRLKKENAAGLPYWLKDLPADHPALKFAQKVNPGYDPKK